MTKSRRKTPRKTLKTDPGGEHRLRILLTLLGICGSLERLQKSAIARRACRAVAIRLRSVVSEEKENGVAAKR